MGGIGSVVVMVRGGWRGQPSDIRIADASGFAMSYRDRMIKEIDVNRRDTDRLRTLVVNHRTKGATRSQLYLDALRELERRAGGGLDFDKSYQTIRRAAGEKRFLSYKELADAS